MKAADKLKATLGANMNESMSEFGGRAPVPAPALSGRTDKYEGTTAIKGARSVPLAMIVADPNQPRKDFDDDALGRLARSLKDRGQLMPARVRWSEDTGRWVLVAGERRFRAAGIAGLTHLLCVEAQRPLSGDELLEEQLTENCVREDLKPVEQARAYRALMESRGMSQRQLAEHLHVAPSSVTEALALLSLPAPIQADVDAGEIAAGTAYEISKVADPVRQETLATLAKGGRLKRSQARELARPKPARSVYKVAGGQVVVNLTVPGATIDDIEAALTEALKLVRVEKKANLNAA